MTVRYNALSFAKFILTYCTSHRKYINKFQLYGIMSIVQKEFIRRKEYAFIEAIIAHPVGPWIPSIDRYYCMYAANPIFETYTDFSFYNKNEPQYKLIIDIIDSLYSSLQKDYFSFMRKIKGIAYQEARNTISPYIITKEMYLKEIKKEEYENNKLRLY